MVTSFTFDGPTSDNWWFWRLNRKINDVAYTHHTWFMYLQADDGRSHFPTYRGYMQNRCKDRPLGDY